MKDKITKAHVDNIFNESTLLISKAHKKITIISCRLPNGYVITESSLCTTLEADDQDIVDEASTCIQRIKDKIYELEGYLLHQRSFEEEQRKKFTQEDINEEK